MLLGLIAARAMAVGFELPAYSDAATFFQPIEATVDQILHRARQCLH